MSDTKKGSGEVRITGLSPKRREEISNILSHTGLGVSELFRPEIIKVIERYPKEQRDHPKPEFP